MGTYMYMYIGFCFCWLGNILHKNRDNWNLKMLFICLLFWQAELWYKRSRPSVYYDRFKLVIHIQIVSGSDFHTVRSRTIKVGQLWHLVGEGGGGVANKTSGLWPPYGLLWIYILKSCLNHTFHTLRHRRPSNLVS